MSLSAQQNNDSVKNVLYINSYHLAYSWSDSVTLGVLSRFSNKDKLALYVEYLDAKRFNTNNFELTYNLLKNKYANTKINAVILSDNVAVEFMMQYGDSIAPDAPVAFCGINNPENYNFENTRYYGIKEGVNLDSVAHLILKVMPNVETLYFIGDSTKTSLVNLNYARAMEKDYKDWVRFKFITNASIDSLYRMAPHFEKNSAIALVNVFQNNDRTPINSDIFLDSLAKLSSIPVFMDSETSFGKGILGGIINSGSKHGKSAADLAIQFCNNSHFKPEKRVKMLKDNYYFDFVIAKKYGLDVTLFPLESIIINKPVNILHKYKFYIIGVLVVISFLLLVILILFLNISRRRKAEYTVDQKLNEIKEKNSRLEEAYTLVNDTNTKLELTNKTLIKAREQADASNRLKSSFLANMSHEIRTPLNAIVGFSSLLSEPTLEDAERVSFIDMIGSNSDHLLKLINDILDFSQIEAGIVKIKIEHINVLPVLEEIFNSFTFKRIKNVDYRLCINNATSLYIHVDQLRFYQILNNFYSNAIKFTKEGYIEMGFTQNDGKVTFFVKDTGIGISDEEVEYIFDRFWKSEDNMAAFKNGTGIGLSISKKLAELLGGEIIVESKKGVGSTFALELPLNATQIQKNK